MVARGHIGPVAQLLVDLEGALGLPPGLLVVSLVLGQHAWSIRKLCLPMGVSWDPGEYLLTEALFPAVGPPSMELVACPVRDCESLVEFTSDMVVIARFQ